MESPRERVCPSCAAPAQTPQRWCLECGAELPQPRRSALRPTVGIATTLAVLVGAASAGGYTLLRHDRQPPPPATTVAQAPPATTPSTLPPATQEPPASAPSTPLPFPSTPQTSPTTPPVTHTSSVTPSTSKTHDSGGAGATTPTTPQKAQMSLANVALGAAVVVYAPYAADNVDLGDASLVVDGTTRTGWRTPVFTDPATPPQLGVYVDLASTTKLRSLVIQSSTPGMSVEIYGATKGPPSTIVDPGWDHIATRRGLAKKTTIPLSNRTLRYVLVWIVGLPPGAHTAALSELSLLSLQPD